MCTKCRGFTNAPIGQKKRRCSYCGSIIDITKANLAVFNTAEQASAAVKEFNASKGGEDFKDAVERSRARVKTLMPSRPIKAQDLSDDSDSAPPQGKRRVLMAILEKEARKKPCSLDRLEEISEAKGLQWTWVEKQIEALARTGSLIFPRPWTIQMVALDASDTEPESPIKDITEEIVLLLRRNGGKMKVEDVIRSFTIEGISESSVEASLERLMRAGDIFQPGPGLVKIV